MTTRIACTSPGCTGMILPETAARTGGLCMPCVQAKARREDEAYVAAKRREVDPYAGVTDPLELIQLSHTRRPFSRLVRYLPCPQSLEDLYASLDPGRVAALIRYAT